MKSITFFCVLFLSIFVSANDYSAINDLFSSEGFSLNKDGNITVTSDWNMSTRSTAVERFVTYRKGKTSIMAEYVGESKTPTALSYVFADLSLKKLSFNSQSYFIDLKPLERV